jgi:hypothetical protein
MATGGWRKSRTANAAAAAAASRGVFMGPP